MTMVSPSLMTQKMPIEQALNRLRHPLTSSKTYVDLLLDGAVGELTVRQRDLLHRASRSLTHLDRIIATFGQLDEIESRRIELRMDAVEVSEAVREPLESLEALANEKEIEFRLSGLDGLVPVMADQQLLTQVLTNLIGNAVKFSNGGKTVEVEGRVEGGEVHITIRDHGIGISKADQNRLFSHLLRGSEAVRRRIRRTGLGLVIAKALVEAMGGRIWFESKVGKGSAFSFSMPVASKTDLAE